VRRGPFHEYMLSLLSRPTARSTTSYCPETWAREARRAEDATDARCAIDEAWRERAPESRRIQPRTRLPRGAPRGINGVVATLEILG